jgi:hypothetical protein
MNDRKNGYGFGLGSKENQVGESIDFRKSHWRNVSRERLRAVCHVIESPVDVLAKSIGECG